MARRMPALLVITAMLAAGGAVWAQVTDCAECHEVDSDPILESPHGTLECVDCHVGFEEESHPEEMETPDCGSCHDTAASEFAESVHGESALRGEDAWVSGCASCHGRAHELRPTSDPESPVHNRSLAVTCGRCHADPQMAERLGFRLVQPLAAYQGSVHSRAVTAGRDGAGCSSCHGSHGIFAEADPRSSVHRRSLPDTCALCHAEIAETYALSVHGQAAEDGVRESPVCTDCHGEHHILSPSEKGAPVFASNIPKMTCGRCHGDLRLSEKFGLDEGKVRAYEYSYHGLAARTGAVTMAHCASCHGIHDILPSSDPRSHIHADNLAATCGACHPGAGATFAIGEVHVLPTEREHAAAYWVRLIYIWLIVLVISGMVAHNGLDLYRKGQLPRRPLPVETVGPARMSGGFRIAHALFATSFIVLVYTGFALRFPEAWWSRPLLQWEDTFGLRGWLHRVAAILMLTATAVHLVHLALIREARRCIAAMRPTKHDARELRERLRYLLGRRAEPPRLEWLSYHEKVEYLAVVWGTTVMTVTGFIRWFDDFALRWLPKWIVDVNTEIHFYEAILAGLAILVWHFYAVIFDPVVYPMDPAWLTGRSAPGRAAERREGPGSNRIGET